VRIFLVHPHLSRICTENIANPANGWFAAASLNVALAYMIHARPVTMASTRPRLSRDADQRPACQSHCHLACCLSAGSQPSLPLPRTAGQVRPAWGDPRTKSCRQETLRHQQGPWKEVPPQLVEDHDRERSRVAFPRIPPRAATPRSVGKEKPAHKSGGSATAARNNPIRTSMAF